MASSEGEWIQISKTNEDKILESVGCPPEFVAKMSGAGIPLQLSIKRNGSGGWEWTARLGQMSAHTSVVEGQDHSIGAHAPQRFLFQQSSKAVPTRVSDTVIEENIVSSQGAKLGEMRYEVAGDEMSSTTVIGDVRGVSTFKRA